MPKGSSYNAKGLLSRPFRKAAAEGGRRRRADRGGATTRPQTIPATIKNP